MPGRALSAALRLRAMEQLLFLYKRTVSPFLPGSCRFSPTCSEYAAEACYRHGSILGGALAAWRLLRCNPFGGSGLDPVPHTFPRNQQDDCTHTR